jgi:hypothetical protein
MTILRFGYPTRVVVGLVLLLSFTFISSLRLLWTAGTTVATSDEIAAYETRFAKLKRALPKRGMVGYVSEPKGTNRHSAQEYGKRHFWTQYSLSPVIVARDTSPELVVGNFHTRGLDPRVSASGLTLVQEFGDGVYLFSHNPR